VANVHHEHQKISSNIEEFGLDIRVVVEPEIRGTAGGVAGARALLGNGSVLVWNADILTRPPVTALLELATARDAQVLAVSPRPAGQGTVGLDEAGAIVRLRGKVFGNEKQGGDYVGVMALGPGIVAALPERGCLFGDVALPALERGGRVWTVPSPAPWSDLGDLPEYASANFRWLDERPGGSWIGPGARVPGAVTLNRSLVGARAQVSGSGELREVIVWPNAYVEAPLERAVVLSSGRIVPFGSAEN